MPTQNVSLSTQQSKFIRQSVAKGRFRNVSEVVRAGLHLLELEEQENRLKLKRLRAEIQKGIDSLDRGEFEVVTRESIDDFIKSFRRPRRKLARAS